MKHNWEYKRLGDVATYVNGYAFKPSDWLEIGYPIIRIQNLNNEDAEYNYSDGNIPAKYFVANGDLLISWSASLGAYIWHGDRAVLNQHIFKVVFDKTDILKRYLKYFVDFSLPLMATKTHGATMKHITKPRFDALPIPVPPMEVQERIVAELDKINETIEDCRELLRNLDALAQSLFYDTFGDPITNTKGWPLYKLSSISQLINGRAYKQNELLDEGKYKVIRVGNFFTNSDYYYSDLELSPEKYIDYGDLIFAWSASFGAFIWQGDKVIYHYHIWKILFDDNLLNKIFYKFLLNEMTSSFMKDLHGIGMMHLTKAGMENYMLPVPPLSLQEQFAARIEQIEAQKKAVEQTIAELQTLLDSRMDYWFN